MSLKISKNEVPNYPGTKLPRIKLHLKKTKPKLFQLSAKMETLLTRVAESRKYQKIARFFGDAFLFLKDESGAGKKTREIK